MKKDNYVIDDQLSAYSLIAYLKGSRAADLIGAAPWKGEVVGVEALPLVPNGTLQSGVLYESSTDARVRYYLPTYRLNQVDGRYTTRLKWRGPEDDPNGPLAFLTIELEPTAPPDQGFSLQVIPHQAVARLLYQPPIQGEQPPPSPLAQFLGLWTNIDANTGGMTCLEVTRIDDQTATIHGWGRCHPQDCDWGLTQAYLVSGALVGTYDFGFKQAKITARRDGANLSVEVVSDYTEADGRTDHTDLEVLTGGGQATADSGSRPVLSLEVGALERAGSNLSRCRLPIVTKDGFDRIYQILTGPEYNTRLEIRCFATAGRQTWNQIVIGELMWETQRIALTEKKVLYTRLLNEKAVGEAPLDPATSVRRVRLAAGSAKRLNQGEALELFNARLNDLPITVSTAESAAAASPVTAAEISEVVASTGVLDQIASPKVRTLLLDNLSENIRGNNLEVIGESLVMQPLSFPLEIGPKHALDRDVTARLVVSEVLEPSLSQAFTPPLNDALAKTDLVLDYAGSRKAAVPVVSLLNDKGEPALIKIPVESRQEIRPFWFAIQTNAYMFDIPDDMRPSTHHVLIPMNVLSGDGQVLGTFYQDSAFRNQFYYQPQEFRIPRQGIPPYLPDLRVAFSEVTTQEAEVDNQADLYYRAFLAYRAIPYIDPSLLDLARQQAGDQAQFNALVPETSRLTLRLPEDDANGGLMVVPREGAEVSFDSGIVDEVELSRTEFQRIFSTLQVSAGVDGSVEAELLDQQKANIPVLISLKQNAGQVFTHTYLGPQPGGLHRVHLVNRIESAVQILGLYRVPLGNGVYAYPQTSAGMEVLSGEGIDIDYNIVPAAEGVADIFPIAATSIQVDPRKLWPLLLVNPGYPSDTFSVTVSIAPDYFTSDALTGVRVEFGGKKQILLTADHLSETIRLQMPLLPFLLGDGDAKQYRYRVINQHGNPDARQDGTASDWIVRQGDAPLEVHPAGG